MADPVRPPGPEQGAHAVVLAGGLLYGLMVAGGFLWLWLRDRLGMVPAAAFGERGPTLSLLVGMGAGFGVSGAFALLARYPGPLARLQLRLAGIVGPLAESQILALSLFSAVGEEFFFRLAMQDAIGMFWTVLVFGAMHSGTRGLALWTLLALLLGWLLCGMMSLGFGLLSVTVAHALINYLSLRRMQ